MEQLVVQVWVFEEHHYPDKQTLGTPALGSPLNNYKISFCFNWHLKPESLYPSTRRGTCSKTIKWYFGINILGGDQLPNVFFLTDKTKYSLQLA